METVLPTRQEQAQINEQRAASAANMAAAGTPGAQLQATPGPCSPDLHRMLDTPYELAAVHHLKRMAIVGKFATSSLTVVRYVAEKPRTAKGFTGIIHEEGGLEAYIEGARQLHAAGVPFASEVMSDGAALLVVPHLTQGWIGAREVGATGPRYAVRPTSQDIDNGVHPLPTWIKNAKDGSLDDTINAIHTIKSDDKRPRLRGTQLVKTHPNPHLGVILRGQSHKPDKATKHIIEDEVGETRQRLDAEFGVNKIPLMIDISHAHAAYEGGGESGQLLVAAAVSDLIVTGARIDGWMAETYILPGRQKETEHVIGRSITDACIGQDNAEALIRAMDSSWKLAGSREPIHV